MSYYNKEVFSGFRPKAERRFCHDRRPLPGGDRLVPCLPRRQVFPAGCLPGGGGRRLPAVCRAGPASGAAKNPLLGPFLAVPALVFVLGTALRRAINRPRPYEALGFAPLFPKDTKGQSFPSRHCFSAACIAVAASQVCPAAAAVLGLLALVIALTRVLCGVHYISDVLGGLVFGAAASWLGLTLWFCISG